MQTEGWTAIHTDKPREWDVKQHSILVLDQEPEAGRRAKVNTDLLIIVDFAEPTSADLFDCVRPHILFMDGNPYAAYTYSLFI